MEYYQQLKNRPVKKTFKEKHLEGRNSEKVLHSPEVRTDLQIKEKTKLLE